MFLTQILRNHVRSVSVIGLGKNTGKTFTLNQLLMEARRLDINTAITTIGLDGEKQDSLFHHTKPQIEVSRGQIIANAKGLLLESGLDYEILGMTGIMTPLGEVSLARARSGGRTVLAGPSTRHELALVKEQLEQFGIELLLVDGAIDRRSLSAPLVTDTTVLTVGAEVAWDRPTLLEKLELHYKILTLPAFNNPDQCQYIRNAGKDLKVAIFSAHGVQGTITQQEFLANRDCLSEHITTATQTIYIRGMLTDEILTTILTDAPRIPFTLVATDPTCVFLSGQSLQRLLFNNITLKVLEPIHISAVTISPYSSTYGYADPIQLLKDVGQAVYPVPCFDVSLGIRYVPEQEDEDAIS